MPTVYILECENGRYYIGKTDRPIQTRIIEHFTNNGSEFTKKYKPIKVIKTIEHANVLDEDKYTKIYMRNYGMNKVRGGSYAMLDLPDYKVQALRDELCTAENRCYRCLRKGHFGNDCFAKTDIYGDTIEDEEIVQHFTKQLNIQHAGESSYKRQIVCYNCNRPGHYASDCYARVKIIQPKQGKIMKIYQTYDDSD
jgi:predicted GIY-YIG superfamily endonuclease